MRLPIIPKGQTEPKYLDLIVKPCSREIEDAGKKGGALREEAKLLRTSSAAGANGSYNVSDG
ncbi:MAG: hypothetical protein DLM52_13550 [Chthoniobacterales bacterium]|nr:MAG: hypothetical protein DLM52_13550 [Chthoniobacterales bacterium]